MIERSPIDIRAVHLLRNGKSICGALEICPTSSLTPEQQISLVGHSRSTGSRHETTCGECRKRTTKACSRCGDSPFVGGGFLNGVCRNCRDQERDL